MILRACAPHFDATRKFSSILKSRCLNFYLPRTHGRSITKMCTDFLLLSEWVTFWQNQWPAFCARREELDSRSGFGCGWMKGQLGIQSVWCTCACTCMFAHWKGHCPFNLDPKYVVYACKNGWYSAAVSIAPCSIGLCALVRQHGTNRWSERLLQ